MMSEKIIYNTFLKISRSHSGLPYKLRKQWEGFEQTEFFPLVTRLKNFFSRNSSVDMTEFFTAPYTLYPGESGFDLHFYSSPKAIKVYTLAQKKKLLLSPDDDYHLRKIITGLNFIKEYCQDNNIDLDDYLHQKIGIQNTFITHLKERKISIYNLFAFKNFDFILRQHDPDLLRFTLGDMYDNINMFRTKYLNSTKAKILSVKGLEKIKKNIS